VVGLGRPFVTLDDFAGATINVPETAAAFALIRALGAHPSAADWNTLEEAESAGLDGVITSISSTGYPGMVVTSNLAVQAVPSVWFASAGLMAQLSPEHREVLRAAAQEARDAVIEALRPTESVAVPCAAGATIVAAADADVVAIVEAAQPVITDMASDPATAGFLDRIAALRAETEPASFPASCDGGTPSDIAMTRIPDGAYTATVTHLDALEQGINDHCTTPQRDGLITLVIEGSKFTEIQTCGSSSEVGSEGTLEYDGDKVTMSSPGIPGHARFTWSADDSGFTLKVFDTTDEHDWPTAMMRFMFEHEFTRTSP
jgi:hypothetical protein